MRRDTGSPPHAWGHRGHGDRTRGAPLQKRQRPEISTRAVRPFCQYLVLSVDPTRRAALVGNGRSAVRFHSRSLFGPRYSPRRAIVVAPKWLTIFVEGLERESR